MSEDHHLPTMHHPAATTVVRHRRKEARVPRVGQAGRVTIAAGTPQAAATAATGTGTEIGIGIVSGSANANANESESESESGTVTVSESAYATETVETGNTYATAAVTTEGPPILSHCLGNADEWVMTAAQVVVTAAECVVGATARGLVGGCDWLSILALS